MALLGIVASVRLRPPADRQQLREHLRAHRESYPGPPERPQAFLDPARDAERLDLLVQLSAREDTGRRIDAGATIGLSGHTSVAAVEEGIDRLLGRDPALRRPPRLAWGQLIEALAQAGIHTSEEELIALPLTLELDDEAAVRLTPSQPGADGQGRCARPSRAGGRGAAAPS